MRSSSAVVSASVVGVCLARGPAMPKLKPVWWSECVSVERAIRYPADRGHQREPASGDEDAGENVGRPVRADIDIADGGGMGVGGTVHPTVQDHHLEQGTKGEQPKCSVPPTLL